ncbi:MAG: DUF2934 domain-containing protein [Candidatus Melainabacteria bacterium]|nr:DUF2934 domain-containing protein [Candidatus Melainabacteria bacterium]
MKTATEKKHVYDDKKHKHRGHRNHPIPDEEIALRAYEIWQEQGCKHGHDGEDWLKAEEELHTHASE